MHGMFTCNGIVTSVCHVMVQVLVYDIHKYARISDTPKYKIIVQTEHKNMIRTFTVIYI